MTGQRIRLSRRAGWRLPDGGIKVSRPTVFGNPFSYGTGAGERELAVRDFARWLDGEIAAPDGYKFSRGDVLAALPRLKGHDLACWCPLSDNHCHAEVLLKLAAGL